jgi:hypothetical protein
MVVADFDSEGYWPVPLRATSNPYRPDAEAALLPPSRTASGGLIDARATSPFIAPNPVTGISTGTYNMSRLVQYLYRGD